ncbi:hypothetical protein KI387_021973 [Taxus chinensis]|uniref:Dehydrin n=1 Tax=Taxus chinensis TaxID=29808 RepID=A0AA38GER4_TAXCH|nr:hypothetical protein KI387_021973 [Taxus chinensis]
MADSNAPEHQDRGLFGFGKKKEEDTHQQHPTGHVGDVHHAAPVSQVHVEDPKLHGEGEKKPHQGGLKEKLHRSNSSSSSSSSDEEGGEKGEKKKKKKGGLKEKLGGGHKKEGEEHAQGEKKEGLLDKIKDKLPGHHNKKEQKGH